MDDRFRLDGIDLGIDRAASVATLGTDGELYLRIQSAHVPETVAGWATVPPRILVSGLPVRFDDEGFGATLDQARHDDFALGDGDGEAVLVLSSRFDLYGRVTIHAGDRVRLVVTAATPWSPEPWRIDVSLAFGGRRRASI
ncbi:hypothetical protein VH571_10775 [Frondihabitans sp. 4ASC-45]|uniref:hypothetical protein n=1 Tax=Frondihabitans sp. 4ASC-45 TaxID=3111636 RepID=UPI003C2586CF